MPARIDLSGRRFSRLVVEGVATSAPARRLYWTCRCDCGGVVAVAGQSLRYGRTTSCGCFHRDDLVDRSTTHGKTGSRVWHSWRNMIRRCQEPTDGSWPHYGGRGITVCERWQTFEHFYADMGDPPPGMSLDRIDVNGNYEPSNCRWATADVQMANRRNSINLTIDGATIPMKDAARAAGIPYSTVYARIKAGCTAEQALGMPS